MNDSEVGGGAVILGRRYVRCFMLFTLLVVGTGSGVSAQRVEAQTPGVISDSISGLNVVAHPSIFYEPLVSGEFSNGKKIKFTVSFKNANDKSLTKATRIKIIPYPGSGFAEFGFVGGQLKDLLAPDIQFVIPAGATSATRDLPIQIWGDGISEGTETARFRVQAISAANAGERNVVCNGSRCEVIANVQLVDPDSIQVSISPTKLSENSLDKDVVVKAAWASGKARPELTNVQLDIGGSATWNRDYQMTAISGTLTTPASGTPSLTIPIAANQKQGEAKLEIRVTNDAIDEEAELIEFRALSEPRSSYPSGKSIRDITAVTQLTIDDNDTAGIVFVTGVGDIKIEEGSTKKYWVYLNSQPRSEVTITISKSTDSDINVSPNALTFNASNYSTSQIVTIQALEDDDVIDDKATITHSAVSTDGKYNSATGNVKVQITDNDSPAFNQPVTDLQIQEGRNGYYELELLNKPYHEVTVDVAVTGANTVSVQPAVVTFTPVNWNVKQRVTVRTTVDADQLNSVATISHTVRSDDTAFTGLAIQNVTVTATEPARLIELSLDKTEVSENSGTTTITVTATQLGGNFDEFSFTTSVGAAGSTAVSGVDYVAVPAFTMVIPAGANQVQKQFTINVTDDRVDEGAKELIMITGYALGSTQPTTFRAVVLSIVDDDTLSNVITVTPSLETVSESVGTAVVTLDIAWQGEVTSHIDWQIVLAVQDGTAERGTDYGNVYLPGEIRLLAAHSSVTTQQLRVKIIDDGLDEGNETIKFSAFATEVPVPGSDQTSLRATGFANAYLTIEDNDTVTGIELSLDPASVRESDNEIEVDLSINLLGAVYPEDQIFTATVKGGTATLGTVEAGIDFQLAERQSNTVNITIPAGENSASGTFSLVLIDDSVADGDETILFDVASTAGLASQTTSLVVRDNDVLGSALDFSIDKTELMEGQDAATGTKITVTASLQNQVLATEPILVNVSVTEGTAKTNVDFTALPQPSFTVTIPAGQRAGSASFILKVVDDRIVEPVETIVLTTSSTQFMVSDPVIKIHDNESKVVLSLHPSSTLSGNGASIGEGAGPSVVFVKAAFPPGITFDVPVEVQVTLRTLTAPTRGLSASDYKGTLDPPFTITIPANSSHGSGRFNISPVDDDTDEYTEYLSVVGTVRKGKSGVAYSVTGTQLAVVDNDFPVLSFKFSRSFSLLYPLNNFEEGTEADGEIEFTVRLERTPGAPPVQAMVDYTTTDIVDNISATAGDDYTKTMGTLIFKPTENEKTIRVPILTDSEVEVAERFKLMLNNPTNAQFSGKKASISAYGVIREEVTLENRAITLQARKMSGGWLNQMSFSESDGSVAIEFQACWLSGQTLRNNKTVVPVYIWTSRGSTVVNLTEPLDVKLPDRFVQRILTMQSGWEGSRYPVVNVEIPPQARCGTATLSFQIIDDLIHEKTETLEFANLRNTPLSSGIVKVAIVDNDRAAEKILLEVVPRTIDESAALPTTLKVKASWEGGSARLYDTRFTVDVKNGIAKSGVDFDFIAGKSSFELTIPRLQNSGTTNFQIKVIDNNLDEGDRMIQFAGRNPRAVYSPSRSDPAPRVTIKPTSISIVDDDDIGDEILLKLSRRYYVAGESAKVAVSAEWAGEAVRTTDTEIRVAIAGGTATAGKEYQAYDSSGNVVRELTLTIPANQSTSTGNSEFRLQTNIVDEMVAGSSRSIVINGAATGFTVKPQTMHIFKNLDATNRYNDHYTLLLSSKSTFQEDDGDVTLTVNVMWRDGAPKSYDRPFNLILVNQSLQVLPEMNQAQFRRSSNIDIVNLSENQQFVLPAGQSGISVSAKLRIKDDDIPEFTEYITLAAYGLSTEDLALCNNQGKRTGCVVLRGLPRLFGHTRLAIQDNDAIQLTVDDVKVAEGDSVTLSGILENSNSKQPVVVTWKTGAEGDTATADADYESAEGRWIFNPGQARISTVIATIDDVIAEGDEVVSLLLRNSNSSSTDDSFIIALPSDHPTVTIQDNDDVPEEIRLSVTPAEISEGAGETTINVTAEISGSTTFSTAKVIPIAVSGSGNSGVVGFTPVETFNLTIDATKTTGSKTFQLTPTDNQIDENDEMVTIDGSLSGVTIVSAELRITDNDENKAVTVAPAELTVAEGGSGSYTVVLGTQPAGDVTVTVGGTAGDVTVDSATLTFTAANYDTAQTVTVSAAEDNDGDADPPVKLTHAASGGGYGGVTVGAVTVTVTENDTKAVTVAPAELTVAEGGSGSYTVVLGTQPAGDVTVTVGGTAGDVTVDSATLTFTAANYDTAQTVTVSAAEDNDGDADPPVKLTHAASGGGYGGVTVGAVTVTVTENDTKAVTVAPAELTVAEGGSGSYTVVLGTQPAGDVTVTVGGTAGDVTVDSATLTFTAANYDTAQTVTVSAAEDNDGDADPPVKLTHAASGGGYGGVTVGAVTVTVTENDTKAVTVAPAELTVAEGGSGSYTVVLGTQPAGDVTVTVGGTAGDVTVDSATLTFTAANYDTAQTVTVSAAEDNDGDADPPVKLTHAASGGGYGGVTVGAVTVTVTENDTKAVTVAPAELTVAEGGSGSYTVVLGTQPAGDVTVTVGGTAGDVTVDSATLTFTAANYDTAQTVTVSAAEDNDGDADPPVKLTHAASGGGYGGVTVGAVTVTVTENDTKAVTVAPAELTVAEGGSGSYTVVLGTQPAGDVTVTVGGTAGDVTVDSATLTFTAANYDTAQTVTVSAAEDNDGDADPPVKLTHAASGGGYGGVTVGAVTVTVTENDTKAVTVAPAELTVAEGGSGSYTVVLGTQPAGDVTVTVGGTAGDVTVDSATLTFTAANYDTAQTVTVSAAEDNDGDADPPVKLTHAASGGGYGGVTVGAVTVTVTENDTKAVTVAPAELTVAEGGSGSYTVVLGTQPAGDVTVTVGGTAGDVTVDSATLTFTAANYDTAQTVTVSAAEDNDGDADPPVKLTHAASGGGYGGVTVGAVTVTVTENDTKAVTVAPAELTVAEGGSGSYTVVLGTQPAGDVTVTVGGTAGDVTVDSATLTFTAANYDTAQTVTVSAAEDNDGDADPPVKLTHAASGGGYGGVTVGAVTVTVTENDTKAVTVAPAELTVAEGGSGSYTVVLGTQPAGDVTVTVGGTAGDVTVDSATLTFTAANYDTAQTVTVSAAEDNDGDADPPVKLTHAASGGGYGGVTVGAVTVTVTENDTKAVTVAPAELTVAEGGSGSYTVVLGTQPAGDVTVTVGGTAGDVTVDSATLTFTAANYDTAQTVTVSAAEDNDGDADPPVKLTHAASGGGYGGVTVGAVTVTVTENDTKAVTVAPAELTVAEGGSGSYTVVLGTQPAGDVTVTVGGTAGDVTVDSATLTFTAANYDTAQTVTVSAAEDNDGDADPPVKLTHAASGGGYGGVTVGAVTVTVTENDTKAVTVAPAELTVAEGGSGSYTVVLGTQPAGDVTVTVGGTAGDVTVDSATLTFTAANYDTAQTVTVSAAEDNDGDADPPVKLTHAASGGGYGGVTVGAVTVTVTENDTKAVTVAPAELTVAEGGSGSYTVVLGTQPAGDVTVTVGGTAGDVTVDSATLTFTAANYDTAQTVTVSAAEDNDGDADPPVKLTHAASGGGYGGVTVGAVTVTVTENDTKAVTVAPAELTVAEGGSGSYTVVLGTQPAGDVTVTVGGTAGDVTVDSATLTFTAANYDTAQTVTVSAAEDNDGDADPPVKLTHAASGGGYGGVTVGAVTVTVTENDTKAVTVAPAELTVAEGGSGSYTVVLGTQPAGDVTVTVGGTAGDVTVDSATLTFTAANYDTAQTVTVSAAEDNDGDADPPVKLTHAASGGGYGGVTVGAVTVTVTENDTKAVTVAPAELTVAEGGSGSYTVVLGTQPAGDVTVTVGGTAGDVTVDSATLTFTAANYDTAQTVTVSAAEDNDGDADPPVKLTHAASGGGYGGVTVGAVTVTVTENDTKAVTVAPAELTVAEGGSGSYTVVLGTQPAGDVTVTVGGTAGDVTVDSATLTFTAANYDTAQTVTVSAAEDNDGDADPPVKLTHAASGGGYGGVTVGAVTVTVTENDTKAVTVAPAELTVAEGGSGSYTVVLGTQPAGDVTVTVGGTAGDVTVDSATLTFTAANYDTAQTVTVSAAEDNDGDADPPVKLTHAASGGGYGGVTVGAVTVTVTENDTKAVTVAPAELTVAEGGSGSYTVVLGTQPAGDVTVTVGGTAGDVTVDSATLTFTAANYDTAQTVTVSAAEDNDGDADPPVKLTHAASGGGYGGVTVGAVTVTVTENDTKAVTVAPAELTVAEGGSGSYTVVLGTQPAGDVTVTVGGTAGDVTVDSATLTFTAANYDTAQTVTVSAAEDNDGDADPPVKLTHAASGGGYGGVTVGAVTVTVTENDTKAVTVAPAELTVAEGGSGSYTVVLGTQPAGDVTVTVGGTAGDVTVDSATLTFTAANYDTAQTVTVSAAEDNDGDADPPVKLTHAASGGGYGGVTVGAVTVTVTENDTKAVTVAPAELTVAEGGSGSYTVVLGTQPAGDVTVTVGGTAGDVTVDSATLTFTAANYDTAQTVTVSAAEDNDGDADPPVKLTHAASGGGYGGVTVGAVTVTVTENDTKAVTVAPAELTVAEGGSGSYTVVLGTQPAGDVTVTVGGTAGDVTVDSATLTFTAANYDTAQTVTVSAAEDNDGDADPPVKLTHAASGGGYGGVTVGAVTVTVTENDTKAVTVAPAELTVAEGGSGSYTVVLGTQPAGDVTVTVGGTAGDVTVDSATLTFTAANYDTAQTVTVSAAEDNDGDADPPVKLTHAASGGGYGGVTVGAVTVTVTENDTKAVTVAPAELTVAEGGSGSYTVVLGTQPAGDVTVTVGGTAGDVTVDSATLTFTAANYDTAQTVTVSAAEDNDGDADPPVKLTHAASGGGYGGVTVGAVTVTVTENDTKAVTVAPAELTVAEGGSGSYTVVLGTQPAGDVTVTVGGTAGDVTVDSATLTFTAANYDTAQTVTVSAAEDNDGDADPPVKLTHAASGGGYGGVTVGAVTVTVTENDTKAVTVAPAELTVAEGGSGSYTVVLGTQPAGDVTVTVGGTAGDVTVDSATLTFTAANYDTAQTVTVSAAEDNDGDADPPVKLTHAASGGGYGGVTVGAVTVTVTENDTKAVTVAPAELTVAEGGSGSYTVVLGTQPAGDVTVTVGGTAGDVTVDSATLTFTAANYDTAQTVTVSAAEDNDGDADPPVKLTHAASGGGYGGVTVGAVTVTVTENDTKAVTVAPAELTVAEGGSGSYTVVLGTQPAGDVTVTVGGTAGDVTVDSATLTFTAANYDTAQTVTVSAAEDNDGDADPPVKLTHAASGGGYGGVTVGAVTVTVTENDTKAVTVAPAELTVAEGGSGSYTVVLGTQPAGDVTVTVGGTAGDVTVDSATLTFTAANYDTAQTVTVSAAEDNDGDADPPVKLTHAASGGGYGGVTVGAVTVTVTENDTKAVTVAPAELTVAEGGSGSYTVVLGTQPAGDVTVTVGGTAGDVTVDSATLTFTAANYDTAQTVTVSAAEDNDGDADPPVKLTHAASGGGYGGVTVGAVTVTVTENDTKAVTVAPAELTVAEGGSGSYTVVLGTQPAGDVTVTVGGTAGDVTVDSATLTFTAANYDTAQTVTVSAAEDNDGDADPPVKLTHAASGGGYGGVTVGAVTVTVTENDTKAVTVAPAELTVAEGGSGSYTVVLGTQPAGDVTVTVGGTAGDVTVDSATLTFTAANYDTAQTVTVSAAEDNDGDADPPVKLTHAASGGGYGGVTVGAVTVTVTENDTKAVTVAPAELTVAEGGSGSYTVVLGTQPAGDVTVTVGGTAGDVTVDSATLTFTAANYDTAQTVTVSAAEDNDGDADPPVKLTHAASGGGYGGVTVGAVTVTVTENDTKAVTVAPAELTVAEGGSGSYTVVLGTQPAGDVTVTVGGTAGDVTVDSATLTFTAANYDTAQTVTVSAAEDNDGDADPPVKLTHAASGGGYGGVTVGAVTVTVTENDTKAVTVAPAELTVAEGGSGSYTVVLGTQPAGDVTVTVGGTAGDVTVDSATLTFTAANYDTAQTVTVSAAEDNDGDADPPVKLTHAASGGGYGGVTVGAVTVTVTENDTKAVTVAPAELTVAEGGSGSYTVVLGTQPAGDVTVTVGGTAGDVTVDSATLTFTAANYDTAQTVTVSAAEDNDGDADPPVKLTHAASGGGYGGVTVGAVTVTVTENDTKAVTVAPAELTVAEGGSGSYTVVLGTQPAGDVTVTVGGTAGDVTVDSATLTFTAANYDTAQTVTVSAAEDNDGDADPPVKLTHAASGGGYGGVTVGAVTVTVTENDTKAVTVAPAELTVAEGGSGSYTVVLGTQPAGDVTVTVGGTAGDVTVDSATLTFTAANYDTAQTVTVSAAEDNDGDADPPVKLTHAASGGGYGGVTVGAVTVTVTENDTKAVTVAPAELTVAEGGRHGRRCDGGQRHADVHGRQLRHRADGDGVGGGG